MQRLRSTVLCWSLMSVSAWCWSPLCRGQVADRIEKADPADNEAAKRFQEHAKEVAAAYEIRARSTAGSKLLLRPEAILRWTNPVPERQMHGEIFVWTDDGRPAAILCLFEMTENGFVRECHEFTSLATGSLVASTADKAIWSPVEAQVDMAPIPGAPPPAATPRQRLV